MKLQYSTNFGGMPFLFNLSAPVGRGHPGARPEDVAFVQLGFKAVEATAELAPIWQKVRVTGISDQATLDAIDALQADRRRRFGNRFEVDGVISVVPPGTTGYGGYDTPYSLVFINYLLMVSNKEMWPRLDQQLLCTPALGKAIRAAIASEIVEQD